MDKNKDGYLDNRSEMPGEEAADGPGPDDAYAFDVFHFFYGLCENRTPKITHPSNLRKAELPFGRQLRWLHLSAE